MNKLVENFFAQEEKVIGANELKDFILKEYKINILSEKGAMNVPVISEEEFLKSLPKFQLTEKIGKLGDESRKEFEIMINKVFKSGGTDIRNKFNYLKQFLERDPDPSMQISDILSTIMFLKILSTAVYDFSPSGAGFIFEAFLAALLKGEQVVDTEDGSLPIQDIKLSGGRAVSLKLLSTSTNVEGSANNLLKFLARDTADKGVDYYVAIKFQGDRLGFYMFNINRTNFFEWIRISHLMNEEKQNIPVRKYDFKALINHLVAASPKIIGRQLSKEEYDDPDETNQVTIIKNIFDKIVVGRTPKFLQDPKIKKTLGLNPNADVELVKQTIKNNRDELYKDLERPESDPLSLRRYDAAVSTKQDVEMSRRGSNTRENELINWHKTTGIKLPHDQWAEHILKSMHYAKKQFHIEQREIRRLDPDSFVGDLPLGKNISGIIQKYSSLLEGEIKLVFRNMTSLTNSINKLYIAGDIDAAKPAADSARQLESTITKKIKKNN